MSGNGHHDPLQLMTIREVAGLARQNPRTIRRAIDRGWLQAVYLGRTIRVPRVEAERYLTSGERR